MRIGLIAAPGIVLICIGWAMAQASADKVPAFPGAEGAGMHATGGRGGTIVHVTNLDAAGPGSFAEAVSQPDRIVVFDVSGIIDLTVEKNGKLRGGRIVVDHPNITIAGQTAPGEGICLKGGSLDISASNVMVRHLRSRRGWITDQDTGDAIEVKPPTIGEQSTASGTSAAAFEKQKAKKAERGKFVHAFGELSNILIDHCSASWATDENLTVTHADRSTVSWCIAAEGCDYYNSKQTPPNHSEGSLWGSPAPDGRATMHHMLYANNRLRNPRTTGGDDVPAVLNFYNSVVYNWSEYASHTGSGRVLLNWLNSYYQAGPDTPAEIRATMFEFHGDPEARIFARGNFIDGAPAATADNKRAIGHNQKFRKMPPAEREAMKVDVPFADAPGQLQSAVEAYESVLDDAGATLPARDAVDLRITTGVRDGSGRILGKETDLPQAWPSYHSLPKPTDSDSDGLPDFWESQFGLDPHDAADSAKLANGYANIEHYFNSTDPNAPAPQGGTTPVVFIAATVSRARHDRPGEWRITRSGDTSQPLTVSFTVRGDAISGQDFAPLAGSTITIPAGKASARIALTVLPGAKSRTVVLSLITTQNDCHVGCPAESLVVIEK